MKKNRLEYLFVCFVLLFIFSENLAMDNKKSHPTLTEKIKQKNSMNTQQAIASVCKTGLICATVGTLIYHVSNKFHEKPDEWWPVLLVGAMAGGVFGAFGFGAWYMHKISKEEQL